MSLYEEIKEEIKKSGKTSATITLVQTGQAVNFLAIPGSHDRPLNPAELEEIKKYIRKGESSFRIDV